MLHESRIARRLINERRKDIEQNQVIQWPRASKEELARFDTSTKVCTMNCGQHINDPRTPEECKFLCTDCLGPNTEGKRATPEKD